MKKYKSCIIIDDDYLSNVISENAILKNEIAESVKSLLSIESGIEHIQKLIETSELPDLIFLDIHFPTSWDGWYFLETLGDILSKNNPKLDLYLLTSSISKRDVEKATSYKIVAGFISKPLTKEKFVKLLKSE